MLDANELARRILAAWGDAVDQEGISFSDPAKEQALQRQAVDLVAAYVRQMPADEPKPPAMETAVEAPLVDPMTGEDLGLPLVNVMDLVLDGSEGPVIADFKTSARSSGHATSGFFL